MSNHEGIVSSAGLFLKESALGNIEEAGDVILSIPDKDMAHFLAHLCFEINAFSRQMAQKKCTKYFEKKKWSVEDMDDMV